VILYIPNTIQWVVSWLGIQRADAVPVPITPIYTPHDLSYIANDSEAEAIVCADTNFGYVKRVLPETNQNGDRLKNGGSAPMVEATISAPCLTSSQRQNRPGRKDLCHAGSPGQDTRDERSPFLRRKAGIGMAEILYTGGTTKFPKGVPYTHDLFLVSADEQISQ
jgi:long-chain acyl-CoA synthetase